MWRICPETRNEKSKRVKYSLRDIALLRLNNKRRRSFLHRFELTVSMPRQSAGTRPSHRGAISTRLSRERGLEV